MESILNIFINNYTDDKFFIIGKDYFASKAYVQLKDKFPKLVYGQCYGYVPCLTLGGKEHLKHLQVVDAKNYINTIG